MQVSIFIPNAAAFTIPGGQQHVMWQQPHSHSLGLHLIFVHYYYHLVWGQLTNHLLSSQLPWEQNLAHHRSDHKLCC